VAVGVWGDEGGGNGRKSTELTRLTSTTTPRRPRGWFTRRKESGPVTSFTAVLRLTGPPSPHSGASETRAIEFKYSIMRCVNEIEALCKWQHAKGCCKFKGLNIY
jgi:hypothetical protein